MKATYQFVAAIQREGPEDLLAKSCITVQDFIVDVCYVQGCVCWWNGLYLLLTGQFL